MKIAILTGTTASGKTALSLAAASAASQQGQTPIEIINADSLLIYRGLDIGTAKPTAQERATIPHHLIDICSPQEEYTAAQFIRDCERAITDIQARGAQPLIVGGTGFYIKALLFGLWDAPPTNPAFRATLAPESTDALFFRLRTIDPDAAQKIGPADRYRLTRALEIFAATQQKPSELEAAAKTRPADPRFRLVITELESSELDTQILNRTRAMLDAGLVQETQRIHAEFPHARALHSVGYQQVLTFLGLAPAPTGRKIAPGRAGLEQEIQLATRQLAKSQRTWYRGQFLPRLAPHQVTIGHPLRDQARLLETLAG